MNDIIIDSNFLLGLIDERDKWHSQAVKIASEILKRKWTVIYLDCVLVETASALARRLEEKKSSDRFPGVLAELQRLVPEEQITWLYPQIRRFFSEVYQLMMNHRGRLNFHDALIALAARDMNITFIASFDKDFDEIDWLTRIEDERSFA